MVNNTPAGLVLLHGPWEMQLSATFKPKQEGQTVKRSPASARRACVIVNPRRRVCWERTTLTFLPHRPRHIANHFGSLVLQCLPCPAMIEPLRLPLPAARYVSRRRRARCASFENEEVVSRPGSPAPDQRGDLVALYVRLHLQSRPSRQMLEVLLRELGTGGANADVRAAAFPWRGIREYQSTLQRQLTSHRLVLGDDVMALSCPSVAQPKSRIGAGLAFRCCTRRVAEP